MVQKQNRRRRLTADMIGSPTDFVHFDGPSISQTRTVEADESRYRTMFDRLQKSAVAATARRSLMTQGGRNSPFSECCFPVAPLRPLIRSSSPTSSSSVSSGSPASSSGKNRRSSRPQLQISAPFNFVHIKHVSLDNSPQAALSSVGRIYATPNTSASNSKECVVSL